ncbi:MAG: 30S ribosomal protein S8 [Candidatus Paceibacterota bacterium]|jgi:small subunit ribosomal protein S8
MTDPIAALITMIKNAGAAERPLVTVPYSKIKHAILTCLLNVGYIASVSKKTKKGHPVLEVSVLYNSDGSPRVIHAERVSKTSRRVYMGVKELRPIRNGKGILILSTPKGILTNTQARKEMVGGEALFTLW